MAIVQVCDFGEKNGVRTYRVFGDKEDLYKIIDEMRDTEATFHDTPLVNHVRQNLWTLLLKVKMPVAVE